MLLNFSSSLQTTQLKKLRDLFIGMTLNLTCNIDDPNTILGLLTKNRVLGYLIKIL